MFDLPGDEANRSLRRFSEQAGLEVFHPSSATKGLRTRPVKGEMTPREALAALLAGTDLRVVEDKKSGALAIVPPEEAGRPPRESSAARQNSSSPAKKKSPQP